MTQQDRHPCGRVPRCTFERWSRSWWDPRVRQGWGGSQKAGRVRVLSQGLSPSNLMKKGVESENSLPLKTPNIRFSSSCPFTMFPLPPSDSWGWLQLGSHVEVEFPGNHRGGSRAVAHFSLERAKSSRGWWRPVKRAWLRVPVGHVSNLYNQETGVRGGCVCVWAQGVVRPFLATLLRQSQRVKSSPWLSLDGPACPRCPSQQEKGVPPGLCHSSCSTLSAHRLHRDMTRGREGTSQRFVGGSQIGAEQRKGDSETTTAKRQEMSSSGISVRLVVKLGTKVSTKH